MIRWTVTIGDVVVVPSTQVNPYTPPGLLGEERKALLKKFKDGEYTPGWAFWYAPAGGGCRRLNDPTEVNWATSGIT